MKKSVLFENQGKKKENNFLVYYEIVSSLEVMVGLNLKERHFNIIT